MWWTKTETKVKPDKAWGDAPRPPKDEELKEETNEEPKEKTYVNQLVITFRNRVETKYTANGNKKRNIISPWKDFYLWYYTRTSPSFTIFHKDGAQILIRKEIVDVRMTVHEE